MDDIDRSMKLFADGHFDAQPEVEWKGDFVGILHSFMEFEKSMAVTIKEIQNVSSEVSSAARAGEAGKGFAVVANQVNMLVDQSAQAAKESAALIETSVQAVEKGMNIAEQTASSLKK